MFAMQFIFIFFFKASFVGAAPPLCSDIFVKATSEQFAVQVQFKGDIPESKKNEIYQTLSKVHQHLGELPFPQQITISLEKNPNFEVAAADMAKDRIMISPVSLKLSSVSFEAMIAHEVTHLIVARGLLVPGTQTTLHKLLKTAKEDLATTVLVSTHMPFAEVLCDVMAVLVSGNPKVLKDLQSELLELTQKASQDLPVDLSRRDFSISHTDPRWEGYMPTDMVYNRLNQVRAFVGEWLQKQPKNQDNKSFSHLLKALAPIATGGQLDMLMVTNGLFKSNQELILYLDKNLP